MIFPLKESGKQRKNGWERVHQRKRWASYGSVDGRAKSQERPDPCFGEDVRKRDGRYTGAQQRMQGNARARIRIERAEEDGLLMLVRPFVYVRCLLLPPCDIADLAVYHRGPRARLRPGTSTQSSCCCRCVAILVHCCCCDTAAAETELACARKTQRSNTQRIVHTILIGIHCQDLDLCRGFPTECRLRSVPISGSSRVCI